MASLSDIYAENKLLKMKKQELKLTIRLDKLESEKQQLTTQRGYLSPSENDKEIDASLQKKIWALEKDIKLLRKDIHELQNKIAVFEREQARKEDPDYGEYGM